MNLPGGYSNNANSVWNSVQGMSLPPYLTKRQVFGIRMYTSNYYTTINGILRTKKWSDSDYQQMLPLYESIDSGLANIPPYVNMVYRGELNMSPERIAQYTPGNDVPQLAYTSTAYAKGGWYNSAAYQFNINSIKGVRIDMYSMYPGENEVLFYRNMIEHINSKNPNNYGGFVFGIDEKVINYC